MPDLSRAEKPTGNAFIEAFNSKLLSERLNPTVPVAGKRLRKARAMA